MFIENEIKIINRMYCITSWNTCPPARHTRHTIHYEKLRCT